VAKDSKPVEQGPATESEVIAMASIAVVGAGFSGAVIARELAGVGHQVEVFDSRPHVAGNCHTERHPATGTMVHRYGAHIFHTGNSTVWNYVKRFDDFMPFTNRVKTVAKGKVYPLPINLLTINQFFGKTFSPDEAKAFLTAIGDDSIVNPKNFEEQALRFVGRDLYEAFFKGYTIKQWGLHPRELPASIFARLPVRFNYDDNYYTSTFQGIPKNGYTFVVERMLDAAGIKLFLSETFTRQMARDYDHVFYSGPIDAWFDRCEGELGYRTLDFVIERHRGDYQGNAVINYADEDIPFTRIVEHNHLAPWESHDESIVYREYSRQCGQADIPYYPIRTANEARNFDRYADLARQENNVIFVGRLGTYRYLDMHVAIAEALEAARYFLNALSRDHKIPAFIADPV
jgi:UDP-galactopyranose mutase